MAQPNEIVVEAAKLLREFEKAAEDRLVAGIQSGNNIINFSGFKIIQEAPGSNQYRKTFYKIKIMLNDHEYLVEGDIQTDQFKPNDEYILQKLYDRIRGSIENMIKEHLKIEWVELTKHQYGNK